ncbi:MAG: HAD family hydrolase [Candidatus Cloacimonetes bacterium]|nr:HAD family hydrolase [Candidatus Cloacimonadota bacterium]
MLLIFDLDGTLFKTHSIVEPAILGACKKLKLNPPKVEMIHNLIGVKANEYYPALFPNASQEDLIEIVQFVRDFIKNNLVHHGKLYDGIKDALKVLHENHTLAICTNGHVDHQDNILHAMKINQFFKYKFPLDGSDKSVRIEKIKKLCPLNAVMIGDKSHDIHAAITSSIPSIGVLWGYGDKIELSKASYLVSDVEQLLKSIQSLNS